MHIYIFFSLLLAGMLALGVSHPAHAQLVKNVVGASAKNEIRKAAISASGGGILDVLGSRYEGGASVSAAMKQAEKFSRVSVRLRIDAMEGHPVVRTNLSPEGIVVERSLRQAIKESAQIPSIIPTPRGELQINAYQLTPVQRQQMMNEYDDLMSQFLEVKKIWDARMVYGHLEPSFNRLTPDVRRHLLRMALPLASKLREKSRYLFKDDQPLKQAYEYLVKEIETLEPAFMGFFTQTSQQCRYDGCTAWNASKFFLHNANGENYRFVLDEEYSQNFALKHQHALELAKELPSGLDLAVLNDHPGMLTQFQSWVAQGYLGKGAQVKVYPTADAMLSDMKWGREFDVILTDIMVLGGGGRYLVHTLRRAGYEKPIIGLSEYEEKNARGEELFLLGFDGYIEVNDVFNRFNGYRVVPTALRNFFQNRGDKPVVVPMRPPEPEPTPSTSYDYGPSDMFF